MPPRSSKAQFRGKNILTELPRLVHLSPVARFLSEPAPECNLDPDVKNKLDNLVEYLANNDLTNFESLLSTLSPSDINQPLDDSHTTILSLAAQQNSLPAIQLILAADGDPNIPSTEGLCPLHHALDGTPAPGIVPALLAAGADVNAQTVDNSTPLYYACQNGDAASVHALLAAGASPNVYDLDHAAPLHMAAQQGSAEIVGALLAAGADRNVAEVDGTALMTAKRKRRSAVVALLREPAAQGRWNPREDVEVVDYDLCTDTDPPTRLPRPLHASLPLHSRPATRATLAAATNPSAVYDALSDLIVAEGWVFDDVLPFTTLLTPSQVLSLRQLASTPPPIFGSLNSH